MNKSVIKISLKEMLCALLLMVALQSCRKADVAQSGQEIQFNTQIRSEIATESPVPLDQRHEIGVFAKRSNAPLQLDNIVDNIHNKRFVTDGTGIFRSENLSVHYPSDLATDVIAYHPYRRQLDNFRYAIDLTDQSKQSELDFMYSKNLRSITNGGQRPNLVFERQMAKIHINIRAQANVALQGLRVTLQGMRTSGIFDFQTELLSSGSNSIQDIQTNYTAWSANNGLVETTIFPLTTNNAQRFVFRLQNGTEYTWALPADSVYLQGHRYVYDIVLGDGGESVTPVAPPQVFFETPQLEQGGQRTIYITHMMPENNAVRNYSLLYDNEYKMAYWVAYPLHASYLGTSGRSNAWGFDPQVGNTFQPSLFSGFGIPNVDRGHQIPSADRTSSTGANASTFYFSNMTPQNSRLNQGLWANLENRVRTWINRSDTLYVVTGAMPTTTTDQVVQFVTDNIGARVAVPKYYYKVIAARNGNSYETIGFKLDNVQPANNNFIQHSISVEELERETGFVFFSDIPARAKQTINMAFWQ